MLVALIHYASSLGMTQSEAMESYPHLPEFIAHSSYTKQTYRLKEQLGNCARRLHDQITVEHGASNLGPQRYRTFDENNVFIGMGTAFLHGSYGFMADHSIAVPSATLRCLQGDPADVSCECTVDYVNQTMRGHGPDRRNWSPRVEGFQQTCAYKDGRYQRSCTVYYECTENCGADKLVQRIKWASGGRPTSAYCDAPGDGAWAINMIIFNSKF